MVVGTKDGLQRRMSSTSCDVMNQAMSESRKNKGTQVGQKPVKVGCCSCLSWICKKRPAVIDYDVVLIGGGIMSSTLAVILQKLEPTWKILVIEKEAIVGTESSNGWNNAGTGHSALCELNYTPQKPDGSVEISKAITVNEQFQVSRQFWAGLPWLDKDFIN